MSSHKADFGSSYLTITEGGDALTLDFLEFLPILFGPFTHLAQPLPPLNRGGSGGARPRIPPATCLASCIAYMTAPLPPPIPMRRRYLIDRTPRLISLQVIPKYFCTGFGRMKCLWVTIADPGCTQIEQAPHISLNTA